MRKPLKSRGPLSAPALEAAEDLVFCIDCQAEAGEAETGMESLERECDEAEIELCPTGAFLLFNLAVDGSQELFHPCELCVTVTGDNDPVALRRKAHEVLMQKPDAAVECRLMSPPQCDPVLSGDTRGWSAG